MRLSRRALLVVTGVALLLSYGLGSWAGLLGLAAGLVIGLMIVALQEAPLAAQQRTLVTDWEHYDGADVEMLRAELASLVSIEDVRAACQTDADKQSLDHIVSLAADRLMRDYGIST